MTIYFPTVRCQRLRTAGTRIELGGHFHSPASEGSKREPTILFQKVLTSERGCASIKLEPFRECPLTLRGWHRIIVAAVMRNRAAGRSVEQSPATERQSALFATDCQPVSTRATSLPAALGRVYEPKGHQNAEVERSSGQTSRGESVWIYLCNRAAQLSGQFNEGRV